MRKNCSYVLCMRLYVGQARSSPSESACGGQPRHGRRLCRCIRMGSPRLGRYGCPRRPEHHRRLRVGDRQCPCKATATNCSRSSGPSMSGTAKVVINDGDVSANAGRKATDPLVGPTAGRRIVGSAVPRQRWAPCRSADHRGLGWRRDHRDLTGTMATSRLGCGTSPRRPGPGGYSGWLARNRTAEHVIRRTGTRAAASIRRDLQRNRVGRNGGDG
jgi:hypothetical protein